MELGCTHRGRCNNEIEHQVERVVLEHNIQAYYSVTPEIK